MVVRRREAPGFNLSFLDIMSCGLGAVVLIFLIIKHGVAQNTPAAEDLDSELAAAIRQSAALEKELDNLVAVNQQSSKKAGELRKAEQAASIALANQRAENQQQEALGKKLKQTSSNLKSKNFSSPVPVAGKVSEQYIIGLSVEGKRIAILLDASSSMTDDKIVDIVRRKVQSDEVIKAGPKWQRALNATRWLVGKVPNGSKFTVATFGEQAKFLSGDPAWLEGGDSEKASKLTAKLRSLVPKGGTNLEAGVERILAMQPAPDTVYLVTDGLPTKGEGVRPVLKGCKKNTVSRECREALFFKADKRLRKAQVAVNVVLLPIEGDPTAAHLYWGLSHLTGGVMLSPAASWP